MSNLKTVEEVKAFSKYLTSKGRRVSLKVSPNPLPYIERRNKVTQADYDNFKYLNGL